MSLRNNHFLDKLLIIPGPFMTQHAYIKVCSEVTPQQRKFELYPL